MATRRGTNLCHACGELSYKNVPGNLYPFAPDDANGDECANSSDKPDCSGNEEVMLEGGDDQV